MRKEACMSAESNLEVFLKTQKRYCPACGGELKHAKDSTSAIPREQIEVHVLYRCEGCGSRFQEDQDLQCKRPLNLTDIILTRL